MLIGTKHPTRTVFLLEISWAFIELNWVEGVKCWIYQVHLSPLIFCKKWIYRGQRLSERSKIDCVSRTHGHKNWNMCLGLNTGILDIIFQLVWQSWSDTNQFPRAKLLHDRIWEIWYSNWGSKKILIVQSAGMKPQASKESHRMTPMTQVVPILGIAWYSNSYKMLQVPKRFSDQNQTIKLKGYQEASQTRPTTNKIKKTFESQSVCVLFTETPHGTLPLIPIQGFLRQRRHLPAAHGGFRFHLSSLQDFPHLHLSTGEGSRFASKKS